MAKLRNLPFDLRTIELLELIIESYEDSPGRGLPLGNQSSQWFALYYLDELDRLVKERMRIRGYVRYMDDMILVHSDKRVLAECLCGMRSCLGALGLIFNGKTQIAPLKNGVDFLGWHFCLTENGRVARRLRSFAKRRMIRKMKCIRGASNAPGVLQSHEAHLAHGDARGLSMKLRKESL